MTSIPGGFSQVNNVNESHVVEAANFASDRISAGINSVHALEFTKVISAATQVVNGTNYHLVLEFNHNGSSKTYVAKVYVPLSGAKELTDFNHIQ